MNNDKKMSNEENVEDIEENEEQLEDAETENEECDEAPVIDIEKVMEENKKLRDDFLRAYADAENVKKRCQ